MSEFWRDIIGWGVVAILGVFILAAIGALVGMGICERDDFDERGK